LPLRAPGLAGALAPGSAAPAMPIREGR